MKKLRILITTAHWKAALTCMRSLAKQGHKISLLSSNPHTPALYSKFCSERIITPNEKDKNLYMEFILKLLQKNKKDVLIPISDLDIEYFNEMRDDICKYTTMLISSKESIDITRNKDKTYRFAQAHNFPIPTTYFPQNISDVEEISKHISYPCVIKKAKGSGGNGNSYMYSKEDLLTFYRSSFKDGESPMMQEFVHGKFCGFAAVCNEGELNEYFMFEVLRQYPESGGVTVYARSFHDSQVLKLSAKLIKKLLWTGPIDLDLFISDNSCVLIEINPRFSGTTQFAYSCGVDLPNKYLDIICGNKSKIRPSVYAKGVYYRALFPEEVNSCIKNKKNIPSFFVNFLKANTHYDFSCSDPKLLFWQLKEAKWTLSYTRKPKSPY